jgi:hypothetical protein
MNLPHYNSTTTDFKEYEFFSDGPKGQIKKLVSFNKMQDDPLMYNLAFGDADPQTGLMNDLITSNNKDRDIVLITVANTISKFCDHYGNHFIFAKGSTPARTRLYQMGINRLITAISISFDVYGIIDDEIYRFQTNVNYQAFLVKRK